MKIMLTLATVTVLACGPRSTAPDCPGATAACPGGTVDVTGRAVLEYTYPHPGPYRLTSHGEGSVTLYHRAPDCTPEGCWDEVTTSSGTDPAVDAPSVETTHRWGIRGTLTACVEAPARCPVRVDSPR